MSARTGVITAADVASDAYALSNLMEFDMPVIVREDGTARRMGYAASVIDPAPMPPTALHDGPADVLLDGRPWREHGDWELLTGYTGQYGYNGAVMHASEFIGGGLARDILATPGVYVAVVVECEPDDDDGDRWPGDSPEARQADYEDGTWRPEPAGWAVARWIGGER